MSKSRSPETREIVENYVDSLPLLAGKIKEVVALVGAVKNEASFARHGLVDHLYKGNANGLFYATAAISHKATFYCSDIYDAIAEAESGLSDVFRVVNAINGAAVKAADTHGYAQSIKSRENKKKSQRGAK